MSASPSSSLHLRYARLDEIPSMARIAIAAFRGYPINSAMFPENLRVNPGDEDEQAWREKYLTVVFENKNRHQMVVVDSDAGNVLGWAEWVSPADPAATPLTPEEAAERKARIEKFMGKRPPGLDMKAAEKVGQEAEVLQKSLKEALGEEGFKDSWDLTSVAVDPPQQRRGIGKMLMNWGIDQAEKQGKNIHFLASPAGAILYRTLGLEQVAAGKILGGDQYAFVKRATSTA